jgi:hypothetical protein
MDPAFRRLGDIFLASSAGRPHLYFISLRHSSRVFALAVFPLDFDGFIYLVSIFNLARFYPWQKLGDPPDLFPSIRLFDFNFDYGDNCLVALAALQ